MKCPKCRHFYDTNPQLREVVDQIASGVFSGGDQNLFKPFVGSSMDHDDYLVFADYPSYLHRQDEVGRAFQDKKHWTQMAILNLARMGKFSSDWEALEFELPPVGESWASGWHRWIDTSRDSPDGLYEWMGAPVVVAAS